MFDGPLTPQVNLPIVEYTIHSKGIKFFTGVNIKVQVTQNLMTAPMIVKFQPSTLLNPFLPKTENEF